MPTGMAHLAVLVCIAAASILGVNGVNAQGQESAQTAAAASVELIRQRRLNGPGSSLSLPLMVQGLPFSSLVANRADVVSAVQADFSRLINANAQPPVSTMDVGIDWTTSGPAIVDPSSSSAIASSNAANASLVVAAADGPVVPYPSDDASVLSVTAFFSASIYGGTACASTTARSAAAFVARYLQQGSSLENIQAVLPRTLDAVRRASGTADAGGAVSVSLSKDFASAPLTIASLEGECSAFFTPATASGGPPLS